MFQDGYARIVHWGLLVGCCLCGGNEIVWTVEESSCQPPSSRGARMLPVGHTALEPCVSYSDHHCYSTGEKGLRETFNPCLCIAVSMQSPSTPQKGKGQMCLAPPQSHPSSPKPAQKSSLAGKSFPSSSPLSTYVFVRDGVTRAENKSGAISEYSIPDCVKSSFCDFLMWFTIQWQPLMSAGVIIYFILIQSSPTEPSRVLTAIFNGFFFIIMTWYCDYCRTPALCGRGN